MSCSELPVYVLIGTKAQYIKTAPLLRLMQSTGRTYRLIDTGQHAALTLALRSELDIKEPDVELSAGNNISSIFQAVPWLLKLISLAVFAGARLRTELFKDGPGICVIHGDTASTLLALLIAKRGGMRVAHLESGLRSLNILKPFPEEIVRIVCMRFSDFLFAPSKWAALNLEKMKVKGRVINIEQNTAVEALYYSMEKIAEFSTIVSPYCVMTVHRMETIFSKRRLSFVVEIAERIARDLPVVFVIHGATHMKLEKFDILDRIMQNESIRPMQLMDHSKFVRLLANAEMVITDGGSVQEECSYLGIQCLVLRSETERQEGIGGNVRLCNFDKGMIESLLTKNRSSTEHKLTKNLEPSRRILQVISELN